MKAGFWEMEESRRCKDAKSDQAQTHDNIQSCVNEIVRANTEDSEFFRANPPKTLPTFQQKEVEAGELLGVGQFGVVREVKGIKKDQGKPLHRLLLSEASIKLLNTQIDHHNESTTTSLLDPKETNEARIAVQNRCRRNGKARFAVKRLRDDLEGKEIFDGALDIAMEAKFLASLTHPNLVRLRGFVGNPGECDFMLVLDRLYLTLAQQISHWKAENYTTGCGGPFRLFDRQPARQDDLLIERLYAAYDIARAMKHLHELNIIHRDLKPENIAYDIRGDLRIYDLGLATEMKKTDLVRPPEDYNLSGFTGSIRWMAPEVHRCLLYGPSADVYSFGLIFWNIFSLKTPFGKTSIKKHNREVISLGRRPPLLTFLPSSLSDMMTRCWSVDRSERPSSREICSVIQRRINEVEGEDDSVTGGSDVLDRTQQLMDKSAASTY